MTLLSRVPPYITRLAMRYSNFIHFLVFIGIQYDVTPRVVAPQQSAHLAKQPNDPSVLPGFQHFPSLLSGSPVIDVGDIRLSFKYEYEEGD